MRLIDADSLTKECLELTVIPGCEMQYINAMYDHIKNAPTAEASPAVKAEWKRMESAKYYWYECSNCGAEPTRSKYGHEYFSDYCPDCGARMESFNV